MQTDRQFLVDSIGDIQGTIRAIDSKIGAFLIVLVIPLTVLDKIAVSADQLRAENTPSSIWWVGLAALASVSWLFSLWTSLLTLGALSPAQIRIGGDTPPGRFYGSNLFLLRPIDSWINRQFESRQNFQAIREHLEISSEREIADELVFERAKLCLIRDLKLQRQRVAFIFGALSITLGGVVWTVGLFASTHCVSA